MNDVIASIKARQAAQAAATLAAASAAAGSIPTPPPDLGLPQPTEPAVQSEPTEAEKAAILAALAPSAPELKKGPPGSYRACNLQRFHKSNGMCVHPDADGFFIPKDAEEAAILAHHATNGWNMVEFQEGEEAPTA